MSYLKLIGFSITSYKEVDGVRRDETDEQRLRLQELLASQPLEAVVAEVTDLVIQVWVGLAWLVAVAC